MLLFLVRVLAGLHGAALEDLPVGVRGDLGKPGGEELLRRRDPRRQLEEPLARLVDAHEEVFAAVVLLGGFEVPEGPEGVALRRPDGGMSVR